MLWAALNTVVLFARFLPVPPSGATRMQMTVSILANQSRSALIWGCVYGALFSVLLAFAARRWPAINHLRAARLTTIGAVIGLALPSVLVGFGSLLNITGIVLSGMAGAGIGALFAQIAAQSRPAAIGDSSTAAQLPSA
jgi:hypothetical protein